MKLSTISAVIALLSASSAYAQHTCGRDTAPQLNASTVLPNGQTAEHLENAQWLFPNDESGGMPSAVVHGKQNYCGQMGIYIYIGDTPQDQVWFAVPLDPTVVPLNVTLPKCSALLERTGDIYYFDYTDGAPWPWYQEVHGDGSWSDGSNIWKAFWIYGGSALTPNSTYSVSINCSPNPGGAQ